MFLKEIQNESNKELPKGWMCPKCENIVAPHNDICPNCQTVKANEHSILQGKTILNG